MKATSRVMSRLRRDRPMSTVTLRMPEDVIADLKRVAPELGYSGYQPLIRAYVGQGLRADLARLERSPVQALLESLRQHGVDEMLLQAALKDSSPDPRG